MKAFKLISVALVAAAVSIGLASCKKEADIIGKWEIVNSPDEVNVEFCKDGTLIMSSEGMTEECRWSRNGDHLYWAINGDEDVADFQIMSLDENSMVLNDANDITYLKKVKSSLLNKAKSLFQTEDNSTTTTTKSTGKGTGTINGHAYVDLGLSVKWATCNVGASSPSDYGNYYAWGETSTKSSYDEENSRTYDKSMGDIAGNPSYDAARANWGGSWRLPTRSEIEELVDRCDATWTTMNGHKGYKVTGPNGNSIFLPAAGWWRYGTSLYGTGEYGVYWSSTPNGSNTSSAYRLGFGDGNFLGYWYYRYHGQSVRPVSN